MPTPVSPTRRVLGDKDVNASLNITSPNKTFRASYDTKLKPITQPRKASFSEAVRMVSASPRAGQKRRIIEVEGVEAQDWDVAIQASQATDVVSESGSEADRLDTSMLSAKSAAETAVTSFGVGTSQENPVEPQFELPEPEMSQRTLDKIHAITLPQNSSQSGQLHNRPELMHNTSLDSVGMTAFLNFHSEPSSQASDGLGVLQASLVQNESPVQRSDGSAAEPKVLTEEGKRRAIMDEKAAQLRTRLQLAFFKVETRQTNTPFSRLKVPESHRRKTESPPSLPPPPSVFHRPQSHSISAPLDQRIGSSSEARVAALRAQATMQQKPAVRSLDSLPMPQIKPTAFSARWVEDPPSNQAHGRPHTDDHSDEVVDMPSSPPLSDRSLRIHEDATATACKTVIDPSDERHDSPRLDKSNVSASHKITNEQLSSPPPSPADETECVDKSDTNTRAESDSEGHAETRKRRLTGSLGKGEAASGLLQLMRSGTMNAGDMRGQMCGL